METDCELLLSPTEAARRLSLGRTRLYQLLGSGELASVQVGKLRRIPTRALRDYVDGLLAAQSQGEPTSAGTRGESSRAA
jgi:excisionase family DNA binding protein